MRNKDGLKGLMHCPHSRWQYTDVVVAPAVVIVVAAAVIKAFYEE